jgi:DNA polymerase I-like protein with 3'-5' exonuclease and polymerase domains
MSAGKTATGRAALLEEFAEACTNAAKNLAPKDRTLSWEPGKDGFVYFHCALPGLRGLHTWNGGPRASAWFKDGNVRAHCPKCVGSRSDYQDNAAYEAALTDYTDQVKRVIRWEQDGVIHAGFKSSIIRSHLYFDRDFKHGIRRDKIRYEDGRKEKGNTNPWRWRVTDLDAGQIVGTFSPMQSAEWLTKHYPEHDRIYDALCWYAIELFIDPAGTGALTAATCSLKASYRQVITEGEKDADSFNALMAAAGYDGIYATCLCHPKPSKLASHHVRLIEGRDVIVIGDADEPGRQHAENWTALVWGHAGTVKLVREQLGLAGTQDDKDLTDWIVARVGLPPAGGDLQEWIAKSPFSKNFADELLNIFASTAPLIEPIGNQTEWLSGMIKTQKGGIKMDSPHNAARVWTLHPALRGKVRTNLRSGEVEIVEPPWGDTLTVGARTAATACTEWLERTEKVSLSSKNLEEILALNTVAPPFNPLSEMLEVVWDGVPRVDALLTRYLPLNVEPLIAVRLARIMMGDLVRKMQGDLGPQRILIGIEAEHDLEIANALVGSHGLRHVGKVGERQLQHFVRQGAAIVQISMESVANRQASINSLPLLFAHYSLVGQRLLSTPLFLAFGPNHRQRDPRTDGKVDERCFLYPLIDKPRIDALREDADQIVAEASLRAEEFQALPVPPKSQTLTIDAREAIEMARHTLAGIEIYATRDVSSISFGSAQLLRHASLRDEPLQHIVRSQFLDAMRLWMLEAYRDLHAQEAAFNSACRSMGWVNRSETPCVTLTVAVASRIQFDLQGKERGNVPGILITKERLIDLQNRLIGHEHPDSRGSRDVHVDLEPAENLDSRTHVEGLHVREETILDEIGSSRARARTIYNNSNPRRWLAGQESIDAVLDIFSDPGIVAIDFETYPTSAEWHGAQAALHAEQGMKGQARADATLRAVLAGRALHRQACTLQLRHENGKEAFVRLTRPAVELPQMFAPVVDQPDWDDPIVLVAHNAQFETEVLLKHDVAVDVECTLLAAKALYLTAVPPDQKQPQSFSLKALAEKELGRTRDKTIRDRDWRLEESLDDEAVEYGLQDVRDALELWQLYRERLVAEGLWKGYEVIARAILPTAWVNLTGLTLDEKAHAKLMASMLETAHQLEHELDEIAGDNGPWNHGSTQQISDWITGEVLQDGPALPQGSPRTSAEGSAAVEEPETPSGAPGASEARQERHSRFLARIFARTDGVCNGWKTTQTGHLAITKGGKVRKAEQLKDAFPQISAYLLTHARWNKATKLLDAFGDSLRQYQDEDGRVRGQMRLGGTVTLRHSCENPNLQNQPAESEFRALWAAPPGRKLAISDYDQIELRLLAIVAQDTRLQEVYREGRDVHAETAAIAGLPRKAAKSVNFAMAYGSGAAGLAENFGFSFEHAQEVIARVLGAYTGLADYRRTAPEEAEKKGFIAIQPSRRVAYVSGTSPGTTAINYPIQGGAASVQMRALRLIYDGLKERPELESFVAASVHDEFIIETPDDERAEAAMAVMVDGMTQALTEIFPEAQAMGLDRLSKAAVVNSWAEKE